MDLLRMHGIPVPKIYSYSATSENPAGTEYIFMELVRGTNLGDIWFSLPEKARITVVTRLVELESRLFALPFSASGSLYYTKDLDDETRKAEKVSPAEHVHSLHKYLQAVPYMIPNGDPTITRPTLRHPDLQPNNVFVSDDLSITGLIDWQHCALLPLFLQCGIPNSLQNYGDSISESLIPPELPHDFDEMSEDEQFEQVVLLRRRQLHYFYVAATAKLNPVHYDALTRDFSTLRRKLFDHASSPWEGDNITLKADLIELEQNWSDMTTSNSNTSNDAKPVCPISFSEDDVKHYLHLNAVQMEADEQLQACRNAIGIGPEGWVPLDQYDEIKQRESKLKADALEAAESEQERLMLLEHWIFDDFDEDEYS
ncbi:hypothetical protein SLS59_007090 [Nothophoma quercina]|uniref:Aminoglycoside phosphotransferase domain-containing protein n=1 Tax=Nothophoma quercina TaxID=749835 RepID=A0ABR3R106_9PLEO